MNKKIAVAGSILVDIINQVAKFPSEGELTKITDVAKAVGGCVPNVAIDLKKINPSCEIKAIGSIGNDDNGSFVKSTLENNGINTEMITYSSGRNTSFTQVMSVVGGQRTFFTHLGASEVFGIDDIDFDKLDADILHLGYFLLLDKIDKGDGKLILQKATKAGIKTSIDLVSENSDRYHLVLPCLPFTDYLIINELEAERLTGIKADISNLKKIATKLLDLGVREKVVIHWPDGSICASANGEITTAGSFILPQGYIKGTTGAGDAFCAGVLTAVSENLDDKTVLDYGTVCAAMALGTKDAISGMVDITTALDKCRTFERKKICL